jgi:hypothetical protein
MQSAIRAGPAQVRSPQTKDAEDVGAEFVRVTVAR